jgi:serine/threonine protein kinase
MSAQRPGRAGSSPTEGDSASSGDEADPQSSGFFLSSRDRGGRPEIARDEIDLGQRVGGGAFGDVFLARCRSQSVAVKEIRLQDSSLSFTISQESLDILADFRHEVAAMAQLSHPHIVTYMGTCSASLSSLLLVMDYCPGSLEECIAPKGQKPKRAATFETKLQWLAGVARGMTWLHNGDPQILHSDLKPANILLDQNNVSKVADFGQARVLATRNKRRGGDDADDDGADDDGDDEAGSGMGSPIYTSPEIFEGNSPSTKSDVYSFGITTWEVLSGTRAFAGKNWPFVIFSFRIGNTRRKRKRVFFFFLFFWETD